MRNLLLLALICGFFISSCKPQKMVVQNYVQDLQDTSMRISARLTEPVIQNNDLLNIQVYSASLDPTVDQLYNIGGGATEVGSLQGYLVDQNGNIEMPRIGVVKASGLTKAQLASEIKERLAKELTNPSVIIRFQNFRISVMGEVGRPGVQTVPVENLTILEALALAGDITEFGNKALVKVLRETEGQRRLGVIDLTSAKMFESPYYQLQQNDVVLVQAQRFKINQEENQRLTRRVTFALSIVTTMALLYNILSR